MPPITISYAKEKWQHAGFQKYFQNMGWLFVGKMASMAISFIATIYIARNLGPTNYGQLSYAVSYVGLFSFLASLGIDQILYRDLIRYPEKRNEYMGSALSLRLISSVLTIIICTISAVIWSPKDISLLLIFVVSLTFIFSSFQLLNCEFQAEVKSKYPSIVSVVSVLILNILKIIVILSGKGIIYLALVLLLEPMLYAAGLVYFRIKEYGTIKNWKFDRGITITILKDSFPLIFASAFVAIYSRIDQVMIKSIIDTQSVGLYDSAVRISELLYFIPNMIIWSVFPAIINAKKVSDELYYKRVKKLLVVLLIISIATALPTGLLSKYLIAIIFGASFIGAVPVLQIYVWSGIGASLSFLTQQLLIAENLTKVVSVTTFFGMASNVALNIIWIPKYGMVGAAYATFISYIVPFASLLLFRRTRSMVFSIFKKYPQISNN